MKKFLFLAATSFLALFISCSSKKQDAPKPSSDFSDKKVQFRVQEGDFDDFENDDDYITMRAGRDAQGNAFVIIGYNPKYIKPAVGYPAFSIKPNIGYPAYNYAQQVYVLKGNAPNTACIKKSLDLINKSMFYMFDPNGVCQYIEDLKGVVSECSIMKDQAELTIQQLSFMSAHCRD